MLASLIVSLALPTLFGRSQVHTDHVRVEGWSIQKRTDRFTGWVECSASKGGMRLEKKAIILEFGRSVNTGQSIYRIDAGEARLAQDSAFARSYWNQHEADAPLGNPSGGVLALPIEDVGHARTIAIRVDARRSPQSFDVDSLPVVLKAENALGCVAR